MKTVKNKAFTLIEVITAVVIIMILLSILLPALNMVKKYAKDTQQKAQLTSIEIGINIYKNEDCFGDYPPAGKLSAPTGTTNKYCASQMLAEAMFGQDLLGVHPSSTYKIDDPCYSTTHTLTERKGPYLDRTHVSVFKAGDIYGSSTGDLEPDGYLICDAYTAVNKTITMPNGSTRKVKIGTPVLYYKANSSPSRTTIAEIYDANDNIDLVDLGTVAKQTVHPLKTNFYEIIEDPMSSTTSVSRPLRPDSFLLISAGYDGLYGTNDDICNFEPTLE